MTFEPRVVKQTLLDGLVFFLSVPVFEMIEKGQEMGLIPVFFQLS